MPSPLDALDWPVRTDRLVLRRLAEGDMPAIFAFRLQPEVAEWVGGKVTDLEDLTERFGEGETAVIVEHDGQVIGDLMVKVQDAWAQREVAEQAAGAEAELGWTLDPAYQGRGFATEAMRALLGICFDGLGLHRVVAICFTDNEPSWRLMERLGMRREAHTVKESLHRDRGWLDAYTYAMLAEEWRG
ncbi:GNAT family N-acetyltransferase [Aeromicrobium sp. NPDC092404]|uniref:GNAT family N-acetyltransferase n=1 Tax=Aeromicrobium sp. NPDC092404 TaxID=3154976 RepID=UPI0034276608